MRASEEIQIQQLHLRSGPEIPNHPQFPAICYRQVLEAGEGEAALRERLATNRWPPQWVDGVYDFHHYHSTAHECLAVLAGDARLLLGGPEGVDLALGPGDVLLLPAGTGHCRLAASEDFNVLGAYPEGQDWDLRRLGEAVTAELRQRIADVPRPDFDPLYGVDGPLRRTWVPA